MTPRICVSVIVPVYNVETYLRRCVSSVTRQTFTDIEIILVNDGSSDSSGNLCDELARSDSRVRVIHKTNGGLSSARNAGLDMASGMYCMFLDSDDWLELDTVEHVIRTFMVDVPDVVRIGYKRVAPTGESPQSLVVAERVYEGGKDLYWLATRFALAEEPSYSCLLAIRMEALGALRFDESVAWMEDSVFMLALLGQVQSMSVTAPNLYNYWANEASLTRSPSNFFRNVESAVLVGVRILDELQKFFYVDERDLVSVAARRLDLLGRQITSGFERSPLGCLELVQIGGLLGSSVEFKCLREKAGVAGAISVGGSIALAIRFFPRCAWPMFRGVVFFARLRRSSKQREAVA